MLFSLCRSALRGATYLALLCAFNAALAAPPPLRLVPAASGFSEPTDIAFAPGDDARMFVTQRRGQILLSNNGGAPSVFLDISGIVDFQSERGLLSVAFHPQYQTNRAFYVYYNTADGRITIARYLRDAANPNIADPASGAILLEIAHPGDPNYGGRLQFGIDGNLYIATGDGGIGAGNAPDPQRNAQNQGVLLGKILRIAVNGGTGYTIPAGNPNAGQTCAANRCPEIAHFGLRNPWRFSFDRANGDLYIGDVGHNSFEEVDYVASGTLGLNFGWGAYEANSCLNDMYFSTSGGACATLASHTRPAIVYDHDQGRAVMGGHVYRGSSIAGLQGYYVYGDAQFNRLWGARRVGGVWENDEIIIPGNPLAYFNSFGQDNAGEIYILDYATGTVYKFAAAAPAVVARPSDLSGEGRSDLVLQNSDGRIAAWLMNGTTTTATANLIGAGAGWTVTHIADLDGNGKSDIVFRHTDGRVYVYQMDGVTVTGGKELMPAGLGWSVSHTADLNGDGKADIILRHTDGRAHIWLMDGTTIIGSAQLFGAGTGWTLTQAGDLNGDGRADLVFMHSDGRGYIYIMNGTTVTAGAGFLSAGSGWTVSHLGDLNGDGKADMIFRHTDGRAHLFLMDGTTFGASAQLLPAGSGWSVAHVGDISGDGRADLVFRHTDGRAHVRLMNGTTIVNAADVLPAGSGWRITQLYDLNGDGRRDFVFRHDNGSITVRLMDGLTTLSSASLIGPGGWSVSSVTP
jgi:glucose/arabinose dehydrogenase